MFERNSTIAVFNFVMQSERCCRVQKFKKALARFLGAAISLMAGWAFFLALVLVLSPNCRRALFEQEFHSAFSKTLHLAARAVGAAALMAVLANLAFGTLYFFAPRSWRIWNWQVAVLSGALGGVVFGLLIPVVHGLPPSPAFSLFAAPVGGFTCLFAAVLNQRLEKGIV